MAVHTIFAFISDNEVKNVCIGTYPDCEEAAHNLYGEEAFVIEVTQYPVEEGDKYEDGEFRRYNSDETYTVIEYVPTDTQEIDTLKAKLEATNKELEIYSSNITDIQLALTEIYERKDLK